MGSPEALGVEQVHKVLGGVARSKSLSFQSSLLTFEIPCAEREGGGDGRCSFPMCFYHCTHGSHPVPSTGLAPYASQLLGWLQLSPLRAPEVIAPPDQ